MYKSDQVLYLLRKIEQVLIRVIDNSVYIDTYRYYYLTPSGLERLESTCMLLIAIGESVKGIDKLTGKTLLSCYSEVDWKGVMGIRDVIAHHYFDLDAEVVYDVVKNHFPVMLETVRKMISDMEGYRKQE